MCMMHWIQKSIRVGPFERGVHLITRQVLGKLPEISDLEVGMLHVFIQHTSASLTVNENADPSVRVDLENHLNILAAENETHYTHTYEGPDDMPAHIKASLMGSSVQLPVTNGRLNLGTWQGIYLCEHRDHGGSRSLVLTLSGK